MIIQIVPRIPPAIDGVGDYSLNLARQFRKDFGIETCFLVGLPTWSGADEIEGFSVLQVKERSSEVLCALLSSYPQMPVLLHYVGYGYAKRGCPLWLANGLRYWQTHCPNSRLVTMFHEVYASGEPWTSSFWLSPLQRRVASQLVQMSDEIFTSNQPMARVITQLHPKHHLPQVLPVFSNIGELEHSLPLSERTRRLVIFGNRKNRLQVYRQCFPILERICEALTIEVICDIGVPTGLDLTTMFSISIVETGVISAQEISQLLSDSIAGFLNFPPPHLLAKSTVFAAYCSHQLIPCMMTFHLEAIDGLVVGKHYWTTSELDHVMNLQQGEAIAENSYAWYQTHNLSVQAKIFANYLALSW